MIEKKVYVQHLKPGMYVSSLDRPWTETDFMFQGLLLKGGADIARLRKHCEFVFVDIERCNYTAGYFDKLLRDKPEEKSEFRVVPVIHETVVEDELITAQALHQQVCSELRNVMQALRSGQSLDVTTLRKHVLGMVDSVLRNSDASLLLTQLKEKDGYSYNHAVSTSIFATAFGRKLGLNRDELQELAMGCLLFDVGKLKLPDALLNKEAPLSDGEFVVLKHHVDFSVSLITSSNAATPRILEIARHHHERHDGSGYPAGLSGRKIPLFARIAGLVDSYDAMMSNRIFRKARSHEQIISELYKKKNLDFQAELLEHFIQFIGIYPTGSLVELTTGEVAIVLSQNDIRRMQPRIMVILDEQKQPYDAYPVIDLLTDSHSASGEPLKIKGSLEINAYGIDPAEFYLTSPVPA